MAENGASLRDALDSMQDTIRELDAHMAEASTKWMAALAAKDARIAELERELDEADARGKG